MSSVRDSAATNPTAVSWLRRVLLGLLIISTVIFTVASILRSPGVSVPWIDQGLYNLSFLLASALALLRAHSATSGRRGWLVLAAALAVYGAGNVVWSLEATVATPGNISVADIFWVAFIPLMFIGLFLVSRRQRGVANSDYVWLDALLVGVGAFALSVSFINGALADKTIDPGSGLVVNAVYVLGDLIFVGLVAALAQAANWRLAPVWWVLLSGFLVFALADSSYLILTATGDYVEGSLLDSGWMISALLFGVAAAMRPPHVRPADPEARIRLIAPTIAITLSAVLGILPPYGPLAWVVKVACLATVLLGVWRMDLAIRDGGRLTDLLRRAEVDPLTGLMSRRGLQRVAWSQMIGSGLIALDIDGLGEVNDSLGHEAGDRLIQSVAERLAAGLRVDDLIARTGGDEFAIVVRDVTIDQALAIAENLVDRLEEPLTLYGVPLHVSACAGVTVIRRETRDVGIALSNADEALNAAKDEGVGIVRAFAGNPGERSGERLRMRAQLKAAMVAGGDDFVIAYQPITRLEDGSVWAVEALVRWDIGDRVLQPAEFLAEVARAGILSQLTALVARKSMQELRAHGLGFPVTVNVPPDLLNDHVLSIAENAIALSGSTSDQLVIEITEDALIRDPERARHVLAKLREDGVHILVDDFGTGYSGLSMLRDYLVDGLKIDYSYVSRLDVDSGSAAIVRAARAVAHELGMLVVYEGAETQAVLDELTDAEGCVQGFAVARPMPIDDLLRWVQTRVSAGGDADGVQTGPGLGE